jgi:hypothetical protein
MHAEVPRRPVRKFRTMTTAAVRSELESVGEIRHHAGFRGFQVALCQLRA